MLLDQPRYAQLQLASGKTKEVPLGVAGRVSRRVHRWEVLDPVIGRKLAEPIVPNWDHGAKPAAVECKLKALPSLEERVAMDDLLKEYEMLGCFEQDPTNHDRYVMSMFPVTKKEKGSWRLVSNARPINVHIHKSHFKQEGLKDVEQILERNDWQCCTDLSSAFIHLAGTEEWAEDHQIRHGPIRLRWSCLFFGHTDAPKRFSKLTLLPVSWLRQRGARLAVKLDDFWTVGKSFWECRVVTNALVCLLDWLGFAINFKKSEWEPCQQLEWLGTLIVSPSLEFRLTKEKATKYARQAKKLIKKTQKGKYAHVHELRVMCGQIVSTGMYVEYARLRSNWIRWSLRCALKTTDQAVLLKEEALEELRWWRNLPKDPEAAKRSVEPLQLEKAIRVETDWSGFGLAAVWVNSLGQTMDVHHQFVPHNSPEHNNVGETRGITEGLRALILAHDWKECTIQVFNDNITAVSYVNNKGGRFPWLFTLLDPFYAELKARNIQVLATWIAGEENELADAYSRIQSASSEMSLAPHFFQVLETCWGPHSLDCFATNLNTQLPRYFSWGPESNSVGRDFFKQQIGSGELLYGNPPFRMIPQVLRKIQEERLEMTVLLPLWPSRPWWPTMLRLLCAMPMCLPATAEAWRDARLLRGSFTPRWSTIAVRLSGGSSTTLDFRRSISMVSSEHLRRMLLAKGDPWRSMTPSGETSFDERKLDALLSSLTSISTW